VGLEAVEAAAARRLPLLGGASEVEARSGDGGRVMALGLTALVTSGPDSWRLDPGLAGSATTYFPVAVSPLW
jgi:hypothetical protein